MRLLGRALTIGFALLCGGLSSQAPEFAQQYRQRIGGALDELRTIVSAFSTQAAENGLDRDNALNLYAASPAAFLRSQGQTMRQTIERFDHLSSQQRELDSEPSVTRPFVLFRAADTTLAKNTWHDFVPALPIDLAGIVWAIAGCLSGWVVAIVFRVISQTIFRRSRRMPQSI